jgi:hypothetical protein
MIIDVIEGKRLPNTKMRVSLHVSLLLLLVYLGSQVLEDGAGLVVGGDLNDTSEVHVISLFSGQGGPHTDHNFEIVV